MANLLKYLFLFKIYFFASNLFAQEEFDFDIGGLFDLDSIVVTASGSLNIDEMIDVMRNDTTFYEAFRRLRVNEHHADHHIEYLNKKGKTIGNQYVSTQQVPATKPNCFRLEITKNDKEGNIEKKDGENRFLSQKVFAELFMNSNELYCKSNRTENHQNSSMVDRYIDNLKLLIFAPGQPINLPVVGKKTRIFSKSMQKYYNYSLISDTYSNVNCYAVKIKVKPKYQDDKNAAIIRELITYFDKTNFNILGRKIEIWYEAFGFKAIGDFDLRLTKTNDSVYFPSAFKYGGIGKIPFKKIENVIFTSDFYYKPLNLN